MRGMNLRGENVMIDEGRSSGFKRAEGDDMRGRWRLFARDGGVDPGGYRARLQSEIT